MPRLRFAFYALALVLFTAGVSSSRAQSTTENGQSKVAAAVPIVPPPASSESTLAGAERLYRTGRLDAAAQEYAALLQHEPNSALAYAGLVRVYLKQKRPAEAYAAAAKAVELAPSLDAVRVAQGEVYFRQGRVTDAETEFAALARANTREARAYLGLSRVYHAASYYKHAKLAINQAYALDPADPDIRREWIRTLSLRERLQALQAYLSGETNDDAEQRRNLERQLAFLQDEAARTTSTCRVSADVTPMETRLERLMVDPTHIRGFGLNVKLNGISSKLLLDTGATGILVGRKVAERAGIKPVVDADFKGIGDKGAVSGYLGYADAIKIGELEFHDCYVEVLDKGSVAGEDGLIGANVFSGFLVDLDLPGGKLKLSQLPPRPDEPASNPSLQSGADDSGRLHDRYVAPEMKSFTPILRFGHQLVIWTRVNDLPPKLFLIDTGAFGNTISPAAAREVTKVSSDSDTYVKGLNGNVKHVFRASELTLQFAKLRQKNVDTVAFDTKGLSDSTGAEISGILGFSMLRLLEIKIDYRDGLVDLVWNPDRLR